MKSESTKELFTALAKAQGELDNAKKDVKNEFFGKSYADLASVISAAKKPLSENGLAIIQTTTVDEQGKLYLETTLTHSSGEWISGKYPISPTKQDPQGFGSAMTYARRYSLSAIIGMASEDDDGNAASVPVRKETAGSAKKRFASLKKTIEESTDPNQVWEDNLEEINGFKAQDQQFYDDLKAAGAKRKGELTKLGTTLSEMPHFLQQTA